MIYKEYTWNAEDNIRLFAHSWYCESEPQAVVCLVHGLGEHSSPYVIFREMLLQSNIALFAMDLRGHGKSEGRHGHIPSYDILLSDIAILIDNVKKMFPGKKIFLYGNSMGGNIVINYALRNPAILTGVITTAPWLELGHCPGKIQTWLVNLLYRFWPGFSSIHGIRKYVIQKCRFWDKTKDKYMHRWISVSTYVNVSEAGKWALEHAREFKYPILIIHGGFDKVTSLLGSKEFISKAEKGSIKILDNLCHNIHSEKESRIVFSTITEWIKDLI